MDETEEWYDEKFLKDNKFNRFKRTFFKLT